MKKVLFAVLAASLLISCGGNSSKKQAYSTIDIYGFLEKYFDHPEYLQIDNSSFNQDYGFTFQGWYTSEGMPVGVWVKDCSYDPVNNSFSNLTEISQAIIAICDPDNRNMCVGAYQYVGSSTEAEKIRESLTLRKRFTGYPQEDLKVYYINTYMGVFEERIQLENSTAVKFSTTPLFATEDYPFIKSYPAKKVADLTNNEYKFKEDFKDNRLKISGNLISISSDLFGEPVYDFENPDISGVTCLRVKTYSTKEAFTNFELPRRVSISGYVTDVSGISITLKNLRFYDEEEQQYVGTIPFDAISNNQSSSDSEEVSFTGFLTNGDKRYNIEMVLTISNGYEIDGYYRYTSQSADKRIPLNGYIEQSTGVFTDIQQLLLYSGEGTELFSISLENDWSKGDGEWYKYPSAEDCEMAGDNYTSRLKIYLRAK